MTIGQKVKELREKSNMLQRELASELQIGDAYLSKIERNRKAIKKELLQKISEIFNYSYSELETLWLANKVYDLIKDEEQPIKVLKVAEKEIKYSKAKK